MYKTREKALDRNKQSYRKIPAARLNLTRSMHRAKQSEPFPK
jgi:hypothetical protein